MINTDDDDDNLDDIDLDELFNDFTENQTSVPRQLLTKYNLNMTKNQDDLIEFNENDCTAPRVIRKRTKKNYKKINEKQMTMYDYASSISYRHRQFYSSLDNTTTTKTIIKGQKRPLAECHEYSPIIKKSKTVDYKSSSSSSSSPPPDFIDNLLRYLDERSRNTIEQEPLRKNEMKKKQNKSSIL